MRGLIEPELFAAAYAAVLVAELVGDKLLYTVGALAARHSARTVLRGMVPAFGIKALVAVLFGGVLAAIPDGLLRAITTASFLATAIVLWRRTSSDAPVREGRGALLSFGTLASTEWGDVGQLTTAALVARTHAPLTIWIAATLALTTKGLLALVVGAELRRRVSPAALRYGAVVVCVTLALLTATLAEH